MDEKFLNQNTDNSGESEVSPISEPIEQVGSTEQNNAQPAREEPTVVGKDQTDAELPVDGEQPVEENAEKTAEAEASAEGEEPDAEQPKKNSTALILALVATLIAVSVAVFSFWRVFAPKARFFDGLQEILLRHTGEVQASSDELTALLEWPENLTLDASVTDGEGQADTALLKYNGTSAEVQINHNSVQNKLYFDKDIAVISNESGAYSLTVAPVEASVSAQENAFLMSYEALFESSVSQKNECSALLIEIINKNLPKRNFEKCRAAFEGTEYDAVRFYANESESVTLIASILEDVKESDNELLRTLTAYRLVNDFSVTKGVSVDATIENAMSEITAFSSSVEMMLCFEGNSPVAFSVNAVFGEVKCEAEYTFFRQSSSADIGVALVLSGTQNDVTLSFEGTRTYEGAEYTDNGTVLLKTADAEAETNLSGEYSANYSANSLKSLNIALSSADLNDRLGLTLSLSETPSLSYTVMTGGSGSTVVVSAEVAQSKGSLSVKNGKLSVNQVLSETIMEYYGIEATDLGSFNLTFNADVTYSGKRADVTASIAVGDEYTLDVLGSVENKSGFFKKLFADNIFDADKWSVAADITKTADGASQKYTVTATLDLKTRVETVKMEGSESLNNDETVIDQQQFDKMLLAFLEDRQKSSVVNAIWTNGVQTVTDSLTSGAVDTSDISSAEFDFAHYESITLGKTTAAEFRAQIAQTPVSLTSDGQTQYSYYSADYKRDGTAGVFLTAVFDTDGAASYKAYVNYGAAASTDELVDVDLKKIKKGISIEEFDRLLNDRNPILIIEQLKEEQVTATMYYGVANDGNIMMAVEFVDGVLSEISITE